MKRTKAIVITAIIAIFAISLVASANAMPFMKWKENRENDNHEDNQGLSHRLATQQSFVRVDGAISKWGTTNVTGSMLTQSRTIVVNNTNSKTGSSATATWTTNTTRPISAYRSKENFTYTYYTANLVNASVSSLNVTGYSFFINGTWNVFNITTTFTIKTDSTGDIVSFNRNQNAVALATKAYGELKIASNASNFTLTINGVDPLTGPVHVQRITTKSFNPFRINNDDSSNAVTKADVSTIVSSYGSSPGWGNYDQRMDYNFNGRIDVRDLATAAANLNC
jgi:hypothetical protein